MNKKPLVTVICICHNHMDYVVESLNSVINQTYNNIEIIIIDDASKDDSIIKIKEWIAHKDILFIENKENIGNTKTFNKALALAKGEYILDLATDDILTTTCIENQIYRFKNSKYKNLGVVFSNMERIDENGNHISYQYDLNNENKAKQKPPTGDIYKFIIHSYFLSAPTMLIKKNVLKKLKGYDENLSYEDLDFWFRSSRLFEYDYVDKVLVKKRILKESLSSNFTKRRGINLGKSTYKVCKKAIYLNKNKEEHKALINRIIYELRLAIKNYNVILFIKFFALLLRLQTKIWISSQWDRLQFLF
ncbi:glycosyltransferase [Snuella sedimenti]|uniref:Glycosyltransferase n=1 Tax=Snuella sedimenti TaxID=2798802 RepID=A0A8J7LYY9_9FLAO|nr:glycosyltransferase [Snuella sedimenti]MBJ6369296.1 glycosyltransferase [Snuella sedimenti]